MWGRHAIVSRADLAMSTMKAAFVGLSVTGRLGEPQRVVIDPAS
jgi:hypothetical protein